MSTCWICGSIIGTKLPVVIGSAIEPTLRSCVLCTYEGVTENRNVWSSVSVQGLKILSVRVSSNPESMPHRYGVVYQSKGGVIPNAEMLIALGCPAILETHDFELIAQLPVLQTAWLLVRWTFRMV